MANVPSIDAIVLQWSDSYGNRFNRDNRQTAMRELIEIMISYGYDRGQIERAKVKVMKKVVGSSSRFGSKALKTWNESAANDWQVVIYSIFEPIEKPTGPVHAPFQRSSVSEDEQAAIEAQEQAEYEQRQQDLARLVKTETKEEPEESTGYDDEDVVYSKEPVFAPEMDRSRFREIATTPVMSDSDFLAYLDEESK